MKVPGMEKTTLRVLLLQHSLSGETNTATHAFLKGLGQGMAELHHLDLDLVEQHIKTTPPFRFPWDFWSFFNVMPETVAPAVRAKYARHWTLEEPDLQSILSMDGPNTVKELLSLTDTTTSAATGFDLVVLGWQTWFLSPSLPVRLAVNDPNYQTLLKQAPIMLIGTHRNMWHRASRTLHQELTQHAQAKVVGGANFVQSSAFLVSVVKTLRWQLQGEIDSNGATNAKEEAYTEGRNFAKHYVNDTWPLRNYQAGKPYSTTLAFLEDVWFPCKQAVSILMGAFPPGSTFRKIITALYFPLLVSALVLIAPPVLLVGSVLDRDKASK